MENKSVIKIDEIIRYVIPKADKKLTKSEYNNFVDALKEFAVSHVDMALKNASENATIKFNYHIYKYVIEKDSILNAYSKDNIK